MHKFQLTLLLFISTSLNAANQKNFNHASLVDFCWHSSEKVTPPAVDLTEIILSYRPKKSIAPEENKHKPDDLARILERFSFTIDTFSKSPTKR